MHSERSSPHHVRVMTRRIGICLAAVITVLTLPSLASALPTVKFKVIPVPIPGFPHTGYILGAGTALRTEYEIEGSEYDGSPPPIIAIKFYLPNGTQLHPTGFPTCSKPLLEQFGPVKCPKDSAAGPVGRALGYVTFGGERVEEAVEISSFYAPGGGFEFFSDGHSPVSLEILSGGRFKQLTGAGGFSQELEVEVPLVESVPGAPYASVKTIDVVAGSAYRSHGKTIYYGRVPAKCPAGGFPVRSEVTFAENGEISRPETVSVAYTAPCPRK
jgi:hypothetical protein